MREPMSSCSSQPGGDSKRLLEAATVAAAQGTSPPSSPVGERAEKAAWMPFLAALTVVSLLLLLLYAYVRYKNVQAARVAAQASGPFGAAAISSCRRQRTVGVASAAATLLTSVSFVLLRRRSKRSLRSGKSEVVDGAFKSANSGSSASGGDDGRKKEPRKSIWSRVSYWATVAVAFVVGLFLGHTWTDRYGRKRGRPHEGIKISLEGEQSWVLPSHKLTIYMPLGSGSFGTVWLGMYQGSPVAVKCLNTAVLGAGNKDMGGQAGGDEMSALEALSNEVRVMSRIRHPNILLFMGVVVHYQCNVGDEKVTAPLAVVAEYCEQRSLYDVLAKARGDERSAAKLTWERRVALAHEAAKGLVELHSKGVCHRDLKSPNMLVDAKWSVKLGDFGMALAFDAEKVLHGSATQNPRWLPHEVIGGMCPTGSMKADVHAFGVVLWELLTMQVPFAECSNNYQVMRAICSDDPLKLPEPSVLARLPHAADYIALMQQCCAKDPRERPDSETVCERLKVLLCRLSLGDARTA